MNIFAGIWAKITIALSAIIGLLVLRGKFQSAKIEDLNNENKTLNKKNELKTQAAINKAQVLSDEQDEIIAVSKGVKENDTTLDDINRL